MGRIGSLGGVSDVDKDTYISAETNPTDDNDELKFFTAGVEQMKIDASGNFDLNGKVTINSTDHMVLPTGNTEERTEATGAIRYNSETFTFEGCDGTNWGSLGGVSDVDKDTYISAQDSAEADNDELKFFTKDEQRMVIDGSGNIGLGSDLTSGDQEGLENQLEINLDTSFKKSVSFAQGLTLDTLSISNPSDNDPAFSFIDLVGPPPTIIFDSSANSAVNFQININPIVRYHVGFTPEKLPMVTNMNVKLLDESNDSVILDDVLSDSDVNVWEDLSSLMFSRQSGSNNFNGSKYTFFNLSLNTSSSYKCVISFKNYHPSLNESSIEGNILSAANPPELINSFVILIPNQINGSSTTTIYKIDNNPQFQITWNAPDPVDGALTKYHVEYESVDKLNDVSAGEDSNIIELNASSTTLSRNLSTHGNVLYGTKYKFRIKASNDAGQTAAYGAYNTSLFYTSVPSKPSIVNLSNINITPNNLTNLQKYNVTSYSIFDGANYTNYNSSDRALLRSTYTDFFDLLDITDINCSDVLAENPTVDKPYEFRVEVVDGLNVVQQSDIISFDGYSPGSTRYTGETKVKQGVATSEFTINLRDKYYNQTSNNKAGFWTKADFTNIKVDIPSGITFGEVRVVANVPEISTETNQKAIFKFMRDDLTEPPIFGTDSAVKYVGVKNDASVTMVCGIASLNENTTFDLSFEVNNLVGSEFIYSSSSKKQLQIQSSCLKSILEVEADNPYFGVDSNENNGESITYNNFHQIQMKLANNSLLGENVTFTITAYNTHGETSVTKNLRLIRDKNSINNNLLNKRYITWDGDLSFDNIAPAGFENNAFDNTVNLPNNELLLFGGVFTAEVSKYTDYRGLYNYNIQGTTISNNSVTNASWTSGDDDYRWALFKLNNTVQQAGTASFGIKFYTPSGSSFDIGVTRQVGKFKCNILLPSVHNSGDLYWYDINKDFESETSKLQGNVDGGVTGMGIFDSKTRTSTYTSFKVRPPVVTDSSQITSDIWIRIGLERDTSIKISNIELINV